MSGESGGGDEHRATMTAERGAEDWDENLEEKVSGRGCARDSGSDK